MDYSDYRKQEEIISRELNDWFHGFCNENKEYSDIESVYTQKKIHLNGIQFVAGFNTLAANSSDWKDYISIPVAIELVMLWAYKTNSILDRKKGVWEKQGNLAQAVLDHDLVLSCILKILSGLKIKLQDKFETVNDYLHSFLRDLPIGFLIEKNFLNASHSSLEDIKKNWAESYALRNIKFNSLYDLSPLMGYYVSCGKDIILDYYNEIPQYFRFSYVGQVINDLSDFISDQDSFADIQNGIITYPIFMLLDFPEVKQALEDPGKIETKEWQTLLFKLIKEQAVDQKVKDMAKDSYCRHVAFWKKVLNQENDFLSRTYKLLLDNKYFKKFG